MKINPFLALIVGAFGLTSCMKTPVESKLSLFQKKELNFPVSINRIIDERAKDAVALAITFNNTFDSIRFVVSNVNSLQLIKNYPPSFYFKRNGIFIMAYSGLESYYGDTSGLKVPDELLFIDDHSDALIREPFDVKYSYFKLDSASTPFIKSDTLQFNEFLPLKVY